jgi:hypothetical protein
VHVDYFDSGRYNLIHIVLKNNRFVICESENQITEENRLCFPKQTRLYIYSTMYISDSDSEWISVEEDEAATIDYYRHSRWKLSWGDD